MASFRHPLLDAADEAATEALLEVDRLSRARLAAWTSAGGLVKPDGETATTSSSSSSSSSASLCVDMGKASYADAANVHDDPEMDPERWLRRPSAVMEYLTKTHGSLRSILARGAPAGRVARVHRFLPDKVARFVHAKLGTLPEETWAPTGVPGASRFHSAKTHEPSAPKWLSHLTRAVWLLGAVDDDDDGGDSGGGAGGECINGSLLPSFSVARYGVGDRVDSHDDAAVEPVMHPRTGLILGHRREYAAVLYLTPDWPPWAGGEFVDEEDGQDADPVEETDGANDEAEGVARRGSVSYPPSFNTLVVFRVPRRHAVLEVRGGEGETSRPPLRYSVFGWWLCSTPESEREPEQGARGRALPLKRKGPNLQRAAAS